MTRLLSLCLTPVKFKVCTVTSAPQMTDSKMINFMINCYLLKRPWEHVQHFFCFLQINTCFCHLEPRDPSTVLLKTVHGHLYKITHLTKLCVVSSRIWQCDVCFNNEITVLDAIDFIYDVLIS